MADYSAASDTENRRIVIQRLIDNMHVAMPCAVLEFSGEGTPKVKVQPLTQVKVTLGNEVSYTSFPVVENVPVVMPYAQGAGLALTLPIRAGDTGLLVIPDRGLDTFIKSDGKPTPPPFTGDPVTATPRAHALTDGIFIPGLSLDAATLENYDTDHIELRDKDRKHFISLGADGIVMSDGTCTLSIKEGRFDVATTETVTLSGSNMELNGTDNTIRGTLTSEGGTFIDKDGVNLNAHIHTGVESGPDTSGRPQR